MRIVSLNLVRYGHFSGGEVDFDARPGSIQVIQADNAAGKTTMLNALRDLLFGIPRRSRYRFLHSDDPRVWGTLRNAAGDEIQFQRKRGDARSLLDLQDRPLEAGVLLPYLSGVDRNLFEQLFGLDHAQLRSGGEGLVRGEGEVGQALIAAASGLRGLRELEDELGAQANRLLNDNRRVGQVAAAVTSFREAHKQLREALREVSGERFTQIEGELQAAEEELGQKRETLRALIRRKSQLERLVRTVPVLEELKAIRLKIAAFGPVALESPDIEGEWREVQQTLAGLTAMGRDLAERVDRVNRELGGIYVDDLVLAAELEINGLREEAGAARKALSDLPKLEEKCSQQAEAIRKICRNLNLECQHEKAADRLPPGPLLAEVRSVIVRRRSVDDREPAINDRVARAESRLARIQKDLGVAGEITDVEGLSELLEGVRGAGLAPLLERYEREADGQRTRAEVALRGIGFFVGDLEELMSLALPAPATIEEFREKFRGLRAELRVASQSQNRIERQLRALKHELAELEEAEVPTLERLSSARNERDATWKLIRRAYLGGASPEVPIHDLERHVGSGDVATVYERQVEDADQVADERTDQAERVERHRELSRQYSRLEEERSHALEESGDLNRALQQTQNEWAEIWRAVGIEPREPEEMLSFLAQCSTVKEHYEKAAVAQAERRRLEGRIREETEGLLAALLKCGCEATNVLAGDNAANLDLALAAASAFVKQCRDAAALRRQLIKDLYGESQEFEDACHQKVAFEEESRGLHERWVSVMQRLGQPPEIGLAEAESVLNAYEQLASEIQGFQGMKRRAQGIQHLAEVFNNRVKQCCHRVATDLVDNDAFDVVEVLSRRLSDAATAQARADVLRQDLEKDESALHSLAVKIEQAELHVVALTSRLNARDNAEAEAELERIAKLQALKSEEISILDRLQAAADGLTLEALSSEADGLFLDDVRAELVSMDEQMTNAQQQLEAATGSLRGIHEERTRLESAIDIESLGRSLDECRRQLAEVAARCAVLRTADLLLRGAIDKFRDQSASSQLARASELFRALTNSAYAKLYADQGEDGTEILFAAVPSGRVKRVEDLSDGERDQLYLALRIAAVEDYAGRAEPMPFIADDLLVNFDNTRAAAALQALRDLSDKVQVVFLTHHAHLVEIVRRVLGDGGFRTASLPSVT